MRLTEQELITIIFNNSDKEDYAEVVKYYKYDEKGKQELALIAKVLKSFMRDYLGDCIDF